MFDTFLARWHLEPDGEPIVTHSSRLLPVHHRGTPAMLKIATGSEEKAGAKMMTWWRGRGAAQVLAQHGDALLLERADDRGQLAGLAGVVRGCVGDGSDL